MFLIFLISETLLLSDLILRWRFVIPFWILPGRYLVQKLLESLFPVIWGRFRNSGGLDLAVLEAVGGLDHDVAEFVTEPHDEETFVDSVTVLVDTIKADSRHRHTLTTVHTCETWRFYYTYFPILFLYWLNSIIFVKMLFRDGLKNLERTSGLMHLLQKIVPLWSLAGFPFISNLSFFCSMTGTPLNHIFLDLCLMSRRTSMIYKIQSHRAFCLYPWFHLVNFFFFSDLLSD